MTVAAESLNQAIREQAVEVQYLRREVELMSKVLDPSERVEKVIETSYDWEGLLAFTDRRLVFVRVPRFFGKPKVVSYPYGDITSVEVARPCPMLMVSIAGRRKPLSFTLIRSNAKHRDNELADFLRGVVIGAARCQS